METLNFAFTPEQVQLRASVRAFASSRAPVSLAREHLEGTADRQDRTLWKQLGEQFGAQGMAVPEEFGGSGAGLDDLAVVLAELGANVVPGPFWATAALATPLLVAAAPSTVRDESLAAIAEGTTTATVAFLSGAGHPPSRSVWAGRTGGTWSLRGHSGYVVDADVADLLLVFADTVDGAGMFVVDTRQSNVTVTSANSIDPTRPVFDVAFDDTPATPLPLSLPAERVLDAALDYARVALAAEQVGGARRCLDRAVDYAKQRVQFDQPIGRFQAVQHRCADALIAIEGADSAVYYAAWSHRDGAEESAIAASVAKIAASDAYLRAAADFVHLSGTMGYTREHDAPLYYRRAKWSSIYLGSAAVHRGRVADLLGV